MENPAAVKWKEIQANCVCIPRERRDAIQQAMDFASDFNDGAFMAYMEEEGIDVSELEVFSTTHDCRKGGPDGPHA